MMPPKLMCLFVLAVALCGNAGTHIRTIEGPVMSAEEGFLLGNGDLSVSTYQTSDAIVFRFGKGDVWDRRIVTNGCIRPPSVSEYRHGVLKEGWRCNPFDGKGTVATNGTRDEKRMRELCNDGKTPSKDYPYPCPKPTGELIMHIPSDLQRLVFLRQSLFIEEGRLVVSYAWEGGISLSVEAVIDQFSNVFSLGWRLDGWNEQTFLGRDRRLPVWFALHRKKDPSYREYTREKALAIHNDALYRLFVQRDDIVPLKRPESFVGRDWGCVEQSFYPDPLFPKGFRSRLTLHANEKKIGKILCGPNVGDAESGAWVYLLPYKTIGSNGASGELTVTATTSRDGSLEANMPLGHEEYVARVRAESRKYWDVSSLSLPQDSFLEDLWYATYHARRSVLRGGTVPPGLFFPSTVGDYSIWHGDYHANYNMASMYWGDFTANRLEQSDAYFDCCDYFADIGRTIASKYYGARGHFIPLQGYPVKAIDDYSGRLPLGRMVYMTGWFADRYWERYEYTRDKVWLRERGYPFIRDSAMFYLDFLLKAPHPDLPSSLSDGKYHAFPSVCGESGIGDPMKLLDGWQVMMHVRHTLWCAISAARVLGVDESLREKWQDRLDNLPGEWAPRSDHNENYLYYVMDPEHTRSVAPYRASVDDGELRSDCRVAKGEPTWYEGHATRWKIGAPRQNNFRPSKEYANMRRDLMQWTHPNGLVWAMSLADYGRSGAWTETLSVMAPFQEMLLQSWDGAINIFPRWPKSLDASFKGWRAKGAFIVDASFCNGKVENFFVTSEVGEDCVVHGKWHIKDMSGKRITTRQDAFGRLCFSTVAGKRYVLLPLESTEEDHLHQ